MPRSIYGRFDNENMQQEKKNYLRADLFFAFFVFLERERQESPTLYSVATSRDLCPKLHTLAYRKQLGRPAIVLLVMYYWK